MGERKSTFLKRQKARQHALRIEEMRKLFPSAIHEAGHAVMNELFFDGVEYVTIERRQLPDAIDKDGRVWTMFSTGFTKGPTRAVKTFEDFERNALVDFAGPIAELEYVGPNEATPEAFSDDKRNFRLNSETVMASEDQRKQVMNQAVTRVTSMYQDERVWNAVCAVAELLLNHTRINGEDVRKIVGESGARQALDETPKEAHA
jgi:hypothetical protein